MNWQPMPYAPPLAIPVVVALIIALLAGRRRSAPGALALGVIMLAVAVLSASYALELASADLRGKLFWVNVEYLAFFSLPTAWLVFALQYTGNGNWLTPRRRLLLTIEPVLAMLLLLTNNTHHLFYTQAALDTSGPYHLLTLSYGPIFWVQGAYIYLLLLIGTIIVFEHLLPIRRNYWGQAVSVVVAVLLPWVANILHVLRIEPWPGLDLTPYAGALTGVVLVWGLFRFRLLDVMPLARNVLIEGMADGVIVIDANGHIVDINPAGQEIIAIPALHAVRQPADQVLSPWPELVAHTYDANETHSELILHKREGPRYYQLRVAPLVGRGGDVRGRLLVLSDITERRLAEEAEQAQGALADALRDATASLASTLRLEPVIDRILSAASDVIPHECGTVALLNDDHVRFVRVQSYGHPTYAASLFNLRLLVGKTADLRYMLETGQPLAVPDTAAYSGWISSPQTAWIRSQAGAPIRTKGKIVGFLIVYSTTPDLFTSAQAQSLQPFADQVGVALENARLYGQIEELSTQLQFAQRATEEMVQNVSHELRAPLTLLSAYMEILESEGLGPLSDTQKQSIQAARQQGRRLEMLVDQLLILKNFHPGKLQRVALDLSLWINGALTAWEARGLQAGLRFVIDAPPGLPCVMADSYYLDKVLYNLLDNAIKFSPNGGEIGLRLWHEAGQVTLAVSDRGVGIAPEKIGRIFERFVQGDGSTTRRFGGTGIGLAICREIIEAHGGHIWAESPGVGQGTTMYVSLNAVER
jgi:signal transduction histidine kinase/PAS domain-containing protein